MSPRGKQTSMEGPSKSPAFQKIPTLHFQIFVSDATPKTSGANTATLKDTLETNKNTVETQPFLPQKNPTGRDFPRGRLSLDRGAVIWCSPEVIPKRRLKRIAKTLRKSPSSCTAPESSQAENTLKEEKPV